MSLRSWSLCLRTASPALFSSQPATLAAPSSSLLSSASVSLSHTLPRYQQSRTLAYGGWSGNSPLLQQSSSSWYGMQSLFRSRVAFRLLPASSVSSSTAAESAAKRANQSVLPKKPELTQIRFKETYPVAVGPGAIFPPENRKSFEQWYMDLYLQLKKVNNCAANHVLFMVKKVGNPTELQKAISLLWEYQGRLPATPFDSRLPSALISSAVRVDEPHQILALLRPKTKEYLRLFPSRRSLLRLMDAFAARKDMFGVNHTFATLRDMYPLDRITPSTASYTTASYLRCLVDQHAAKEAIAWAKQAEQAGIQITYDFAVQVFRACILSQPFNRPVFTAYLNRLTEEQQNSPRVFALRLLAMMRRGSQSQARELLQKSPFPATSTLDQLVLEYLPTVSTVALLSMARFVAQSVDPAVEPSAVLSPVTETTLKALAKEAGLDYAARMSLSADENDDLTDLEDAEADEEEADEEEDAADDSQQKDQDEDSDSDDDDDDDDEENDDEDEDDEDDEDDDDNEDEK